MLAGQGATVLVEGPMGIGKTALLRRFAHVVETGPWTAQVGRARGLPLEQHYAFGAVVQSLGPLVSRTREHEPQAFAGAGTLALPLFDAAVPPAEPDGIFPLLHGLHWLCATLADRAPLVLLVDDVQWVDEPSQRWLAYLAERTQDLPVLLVTARRTEDGAVPHGPLDALVEAAEVLRPGPISVEAVGTLVRARAGERIPQDAVPRLAEAIARRAAGNPLLVRELVRAAAEDTDPDAATRSTPASVVRLVDRRIAGLPATTAAVARAFAVLGEHGSTEDVAALTDTSPTAVLEAVDALIAAEILEPHRHSRFVHPVVQDAALAALPPGARTGLHARAARVLHADHPVRAATHLVAAAERAPGGEPWAVPTLLRAADVARARGGADEAVRYLRRALAERPGPELELAVRTRLGILLDGARDPEGIEHLAVAAQLAPDALAAARVALRHADALFHLARLAECSTVCRDALEALRDDGDEARELRLTLEASALNADALLGERRDRPQVLADAVAQGGTPGERRVLVHVAADLAAAGTADAPEVARIARAAVDGGSLVADVGPASPLFVYAGTALAWAGDYEAAHELSERGVDLARRQGSLVGLAYATSLRAGVAVYRGDLQQAEVDARLVLDELAEADPMCFAVTLGWAIDVAVERGETAAVRARLDASWLAGPLPDLGTIDLLLLARGALAHAEGDHGRALEDLEEVGRRAARSRYENPAAMPWRSHAALCHAALGDRTTARDLVDDELRRARTFGAPRAVGRALRVRAGLSESAAAVQDLEAAVAVLADSGAVLEHAGALVDLGAADVARPLEQRRDLLRRGMDLGHRCGARRLVDRALTELRATGARPRRPVVHGADALTPQERRVATLAAEGTGNREIAEALFLTRRTVEMHLTNAYRKLGIERREDLGGAL